MKEFAGGKPLSPFAAGREKEGFALAVQHYGTGRPWQGNLGRHLPLRGRFPVVRIVGTQATLAQAAHLQFRRRHHPQRFARRRQAPRLQEGEIENPAAFRTNEMVMRVGVGVVAKRPEPFHPAEKPGRGEPVQDAIHAVQRNAVHPFRHRPPNGLRIKMCEAAQNQFKNGTPLNRAAPLVFSANVLKQIMSFLFHRYW